MQSPGKTVRRSILLAVACALLAAGSLSAGESRWYLAGKLGQASVKADFGPQILGWKVDDDDSAASFELGYAPSRFLGIQAGYHDLGTYTGQPRPCPPDLICPATLASFAPNLVPVFPARAEFSSLSLSALPTWPVSDRFAVYGKLGVLDWDAKASSTSAGTSIASPSGQDFLAGAGARYSFGKGLGVLVEYESSDLIDAVSLGASWRF